MYNFLVSGDVKSWQGEPWVVEISRCVREYTDKAITQKYSDLDKDALAELMMLPCVLAYEAEHELPPKLGVIRNVTKRRTEVKVEYEVLDCSPFLTATDLKTMSFELDIGSWELNRTHWAVKDVNLPKELHAKGILLPRWARGTAKAVNITTHRFDIALSFPGESRALVQQVAFELERLVGPNSYFYDDNYVSQLARPGLDSLLQGIYGARSKLVVVFLSSDYQRKNWCGIEFRAIREIISKREHDKIMLVRTDDGAVEGIFATDGYVDARKFSPMEIASFIQERLNLLK